MPRLTIPLWLVFTLQSVVVAGAFIAVILVLTLQQQDQYKASVFNEIKLQQNVNENAILTPILAREKVITAIANRLVADPALHFNKGDTLHSPNIQRFMNLTFFILYQDRMSDTIYQYRRDDAYTTPDPGLNYTSHYGAAGLSSDLIMGVTDFNGSVQVTVNPTFPLQFTSVFVRTLTVVSTPSVTYNKPHWKDGVVYSNAITSNTKFVIALAYPIVFNTVLGQSELLLYYSINIQYIVGLTEAYILTPDSKAILVDHHWKQIITSVNVGVPMYNKNTSEVWTMSSFPNQEIISQYIAADGEEKQCHKNCTSAKEDGESIVSLHHMTTAYGFDISLFQITPRSHYFAAGERAMITGIVIGVVAGVIVILSCVVIWFAIRSPVHRLRESMDLAAVMRNDEVDDTGSVLSELDLLSESFLQMNSKLLQARAFMPQSVLYGESRNNTDSSEEDSSDQQVKVGTSIHNPIAATATTTASAIMALDPHQPTSRTSDSVFISTVNDDVISHTPRRLSTISARRLTVIEADNDDDVRSCHSYSSTTTRKNITRRGIVILTEVHNLVPKNVAVLIINARGMHALASSGGAGDLEAEQVKLVELVQKCTRSGNGVVDAFQGDHFVITFNAVRSVGTPAINAARVALKIEDRAQHEGLALGCFSMGLGGGRALVGNVGSATMKKSCTVGAVYTIAAGLEVLAKRVGRTCVTHGRCLIELQHTTSIMVLGAAQLTATRQEVTGCILPRQLNRMGEATHSWLYRCEEEMHDDDEFDIFNRLMEAYVSKGVEATEKAMEEMASRGVDDSNIEASGMFPPHAMSHLRTLLERRRQIEAMTTTELNALQMGQRRSLPYVDFDLFYPNL